MLGDKLTPDFSSQVDGLLKGAIEMHVHSAPDVVPRKLSDIGLLQAAKKTGMRGVLLKAHFNTTTARAAMAQEAVGGIEGYGGTTLNKQLGGLNPALVESELKMGAKEIWLPTQSAANDIWFHKRSPKHLVPITDDEGAFLPDLHEILEMIAQKDVILGTGHISAIECEKVFALAKEKGVKKIIMTHPEAPRINMPFDMQKRLARQGAMFEWCCFNMTTLTEGRGKVPPEKFAQNIRNVGVEASIMATDMGQTENVEAPLGLRCYIETMLALGFTPQEIQTMVRDNPVKMLGLAQ